MDPKKDSNKILDLCYGHPAPLEAGTLTLGCEFELLLLHYRPAKGNTLDNVFVDGMDVVLEALAEPFKDRKCASPNCKAHFDVELHPKIPIGQDQANNYTSWQVCRDSSILLKRGNLKVPGNHGDVFDFCPIEIKSGILRYNEFADKSHQWNNGKHDHWIPFDQEITLVLDRMNEKFGLTRKNIAESKWYAVPINSCGLHVHIGNGKGVPIPFSTAKKVYTMFVACERQMDRLQEKHRIIGVKLATEAPKEYVYGSKEIDKTLIESDSENPDVKSEGEPKDHPKGNSVSKPYNKPPSAYLMAAIRMRRQWENVTNKSLSLVQKLNKKDFDDNYPQNALKSMPNVDKVKFNYDIESWSTLIKGASEISDLRDLNLGLDRHCTISMDDLPSQKDKEKLIEKKQTIEFRQMAATFMSQVTLAWIDFVVKLVLRCHTLTDTDFDNLVKPGGKLRDVNLTALDLCQFVGCRKETIDFYSNCIKSKQNPIIQQLNAEEAVVLKNKDLKIAEFVLDYIEKRRQGADPKAVDDQIFKKLLAGGYGQFSKEDLKRLNVPLEKQERLTVGYRVPL